MHACSDLYHNNDITLQFISITMYFRYIYMYLYMSPPVGQTYQKEAVEGTIVVEYHIHDPTVWTHVFLW